MRGCLFILGLGAVVLAILLLVALPALAGSIVGAGLREAGLEGEDTRVDVAGDGPFDLLGLRAGLVRVRATDAAFRDLEIASLDLTLRDVSLLSRQAGSVTGRLDGVLVPGARGAMAENGVQVRRIVLTGAAADVNAVVLIDAGEVLVLVADGVQGAIGIRPRDVRLVEPDRLTIDLTLFAVTGSLAIDGRGALVLRASEGPFAGLGGIVLFEPSARVPLRLSSVRVAPEGLELTGRLTARLLP
jgi:hypothetical protein